MNAVDTNVLLYSIDRPEPIKQLKAQQLLTQIRPASTSAILLWQVLAESVAQMRRWRDQGKLTDAEFTEHVSIFRNLFPLILPVPAVLDHALDLAARFSLSHWDSMILGACKEAGVTILHTEDMGAPSSFDGIQLVNPFI